jgi:hypothetical protein
MNFAVRPASTQREWEIQECISVWQCGKRIDHDGFAGFIFVFSNISCALAKSPL